MIRLFSSAQIEEHNLDFSTVTNLESIEQAFRSLSLGDNTLDLSGTNFDDIDDDGIRAIFYDTKIESVKVKNQNTIEKLEAIYGRPSNLKFETSE